MLAGRLIACREVKQACRRHLNDLKASRAAAYRWRFDEDKANRFCRFAEAFPHWKDDFHGNASSGATINLEPWQIFICCSIFGWIDKKSGNRRFNEAYVEVARKNGKTTLAALIALYCLAADGEFGAEVFIGAKSREQAAEVFNHAKKLAEIAPDFREAFGVYVNSASLVIQERAAALKVLKGQPQDGPSPHCTVADEYHEYLTDRLPEWHRTGAQARRQALLLMITTAGSNTGSPCYNKHLEAQEVLAGRRTNERLFCIVFTVDKGIDWTSADAVRMANPNYGVSVNPDVIENDHQQAMQSPASQNAFKNKNLDIWTNAEVAWLPDVKWDACADPELKISDFVTEDCIEAVDLAARKDTVSTVRMFRRMIEGQPHYYCFSRHYLNAEQIQKPEHTHFQAWAADGHLIETPGNVTDYLKVAEDLVADADTLIMRELVFDPFHAEPFIQFLKERPNWNTSVETGGIRQKRENTTDPMKELEAAVLEGRFHFDGNPLMTWMVTNTVCDVSTRDDTWFPTRKHVERKIDGAVCIIMAIRRWMTRQDHYFTPFYL